MDKGFMLCEKITKEELPYLNGEYVANIKYDGCRVMSIISNGEIIMINRRGKIVNHHFIEIVNALKDLNNCVLDGEVISYNNKFEDLQKRALTKDKNKQEELMKTIPCFYMVFDILQLGEQNLIPKPLKERVSVMDTLSFHNPIRKVSYLPIQECLKIAEEMNGEGIIIKDLNSVYEMRRSKSWLKLKFFQEAEITLTKFTYNNAGIRAEDNEGNVVQISGRQSNEIAKRLTNGEQVTIFVQYLTKGETGRMRFPSFRGLK